MNKINKICQILVCMYVAHPVPVSETNMYVRVAMIHSCGARNLFSPDEHFTCPEWKEENSLLMDPYNVPVTVIRDSDRHHI